MTHIERQNMRDIRYLTIMVSVIILTLIYMYSIELISSLKLSMISDFLVLSILGLTLICLVERW